MRGVGERQHFGADKVCDAGSANGLLEMFRGDDGELFEDVLI